MKFYPHEKGDAENVLVMKGGGGTKSFGIVFTQ